MTAVFPTVNFRCYYTKTLFHNVAARAVIGWKNVLPPMAGPIHGGGVFIRSIITNSNTHEVLGVFSGGALLQMGGEKGENTGKGRGYSYNTCWCRTQVYYP